MKAAVAQESFAGDPALPGDRLCRLCRDLGFPASVASVSGVWGRRAHVDGHWAAERGQPPAHRWAHPNTPRFPALRALFFRAFPGAEEVAGLPSAERKRVAFGTVPSELREREDGFKVPLLPPPRITKPSLARGEALAWTSIDDGAERGTASACGSKSAEKRKLEECAKYGGPSPKRAAPPEASVFEPGTRALAGDAAFPLVRPVREEPQDADQVSDESPWAQEMSIAPVKLEEEEEPDEEEEEQKGAPAEPASPENSFPQDVEVPAHQPAEGAEKCADEQGAIDQVKAEITEESCDQDLSNQSELPSQCTQYYSETEDDRTSDGRDDDWDVLGQNDAAKSSAEAMTQISQGGSEESLENELPVNTDPNFEESALKSAPPNKAAGVELASQANEAEASADDKSHIESSVNLSQDVASDGQSSTAAVAGSSEVASPTSATTFEQEPQALGDSGAAVQAAAEREVQELGPVKAAAKRVSVCGECGESFPASTREAHAVRHLRPAEDAVSCRRCAFGAKSRATMYNHLRKAHGIPSSLAEYDKTSLHRVLRLCFGERASSEKYLMKRKMCTKCGRLVGQGIRAHHVIRHFASLAYRCVGCGFASATQLTSVRHSALCGGAEMAFDKAAVADAIQQCFPRAQAAGATIASQPLAEVQLSEAKRRPSPDSEALGTGFPQQLQSSQEHPTPLPRSKLPVYLHSIKRCSKCGCKVAQADWRTHALKHFPQLAFKCSSCGFASTCKATLLKHSSDSCGGGEVSFDAVAIAGAIHTCFPAPTKVQALPPSKAPMEIESAKAGGDGGLKMGRKLIPAGRRSRAAFRRCALCDERIERDWFERHTLSRHSRLVYRCGGCGRSSSVRSAMLQHVSQRCPGAELQCDSDAIAVAQTRCFPSRPGSSTTRPSARPDFDRLVEEPSSMDLQVSKSSGNTIIDRILSRLRLSKQLGAVKSEPTGAAADEKKPSEKLALPDTQPIGSHGKASPLGSFVLEAEVDLVGEAWEAEDGSWAAAEEVGDEHPQGPALPGPHDDPLSTSEDDAHTPTSHSPPVNISASPQPSNEAELYKDLDKMASGGLGSYVAGPLLAGPASTKPSPEESLSEATPRTWG